MLVPVQVRWDDAGALHLADLRIPLAFDLVQLEGAAGDMKKKVFRAAVEFTRSVYQAWNVLRVGRGRAIAQIQVNAHAQLRIVAGECERGGKCGTIREQGSAGDQTLAMRVDNAAVDAFGPAQVV